MTAGSANQMHETRLLTYARCAGALYLVVIVLALFSEVFVRANLIVPGDAAATASNVARAAWLFRLGFLADAVVCLCDAALAVLLYVLLKPVGTTLALVAAALRLVQTAILGFNLLNHYAALLLLSGDGTLAAFDQNQIDGLVMFVLTVHKHGYDLALLFFGMHCLVLGVLIARSDYMPGVLGIMLFAAGIVYLIGSVTLFAAPAYAAFVAPAYVVPLIAETSVCAWLLTKGVRLKTDETGSYATQRSTSV
jgi:hypothetical protein